MDLTGTLIEISGRVVSLENNKVYVTQQLLQRPGLSEFSQYQAIFNRQLDEVTRSLNQISANVRTLQQLYVNLNMSVVALNTGLTGLASNFTGHTGSISHPYI